MRVARLALIALAAAASAARVGDGRSGDHDRSAAPAATSATRSRTTRSAVPTARSRSAGAATTGPSPSRSSPARQRVSFGVRKDDRARAITSAACPTTSRPGATAGTATGASLVPDDPRRELQQPHQAVRHDLRPLRRAAVVVPVAERAGARRAPDRRQHRVRRGPAGGTFNRRSSAANTGSGSPTARWCARSRRSGRRPTSTTSSRSGAASCVLVYHPREHVDLSAYGGPADATVLDSEIQRIRRDGAADVVVELEGPHRPGGDRAVVAVHRVATLVARGRQPGLGRDPHQLDRGRRRRPARRRSATRTPSTGSA